MKPPNAKRQELDEAIVVSEGAKVILDLNGFNTKGFEKDTVGDGVFHVVSGGNDYNIAIWADGYYPNPFTTQPQPGLGGFLHSENLWRQTAVQKAPLYVKGGDSQAG